MNRFLLASLLFVGGCTARQPIAAAPTETKTEAATPPIQIRQSDVKMLDWSIVRAFPHDTASFTEGLLWHDGALYESTGLEGQSKLRRVDLQSGQPTENVNLPKQFFGEGLALANNRLYQLTWQNQSRLCLRRQNFQTARQIQLPKTKVGA